MLDSPILEVIIGLIFVYTLLSIIVTQINSFIVNLSRTGARNLRDTVVDMLKDPNIYDHVLRHPRINMIDPPQTITAVPTPVTDGVPPQVTSEQQIASQISSKTGRLYQISYKLIVWPLTVLMDLLRTSKRAPSHDNLNNVTYIQPTTFADTLIRIIVEGSREETRQALFADLNKAIAQVPQASSYAGALVALHRFTSTCKDMDKVREILNELPESEYKELLLGEVTKLEATLASLRLPPDPVLYLIRGVEKLPDGEFKDAIKAVIYSAPDMETARKNIEGWFNEWMGRATRSYERFMQRLSLTIGITVALLLNADTLHLAETFWNDPALREVVVNSADQALQTQEGGTAETTANAGTQEAVQTALDDLLELRLPIGWEITRIEDDPNSTEDDLLRENPRNLWNFWPGNSSQFLELWIAKILGLLLTMIAIAQGAPFWFNILNRLMRGNQPREEKSS